MQPQDERVTLQKRLHERSKSVTPRLLEELGLNRNGRQLAKLFPQDVRGKSNSDALIILMAITVNDFIDVPDGKRKDAPMEKMREAYTNLDVIGDKLVQQIKAIKR